MADPWLYNYVDLGEGRGKSPQPVLRAVIEVSTPGTYAGFQAIVDTGGPITVIAPTVLRSGGDPVSTGTSMVLRLGGSTNEVPLYETTLEVRPPPGAGAALPISWRGLVAVLDPWPLPGTAVLLGQSGFLDSVTVTFGPGGFVLEPAAVFHERYPDFDRG